MRQTLVLLGSVLFVLALVLIWNRSTSRGQSIENLTPVTSRGGQIRFRIPSHWTSDLEDNHIVFNSPYGDSGWLRVSVLTYDSKADGRDRRGELLRRTLEGARVNVTPGVLPTGDYFAHWQDRSAEKGEEIVNYEWIWEHLEGKWALISIFTYTVLARDAEGDGNRRLVEVLDREFRSAKVEHASPETGAPG